MNTDGPFDLPVQLVDGQLLGRRQPPVPDRLPLEQRQLGAAVKVGQ
jgi:hypothetical protein